MMKNTFLMAVFAAGAVALGAQDFTGKIIKGDRAKIAVPDLRGSGEAQQFMSAFNQTLWNDLETAGIFKMVSKSMYWLQVPQQPQDLRPAATQPRGMNTPSAVAGVVAGGLGQSSGGSELSGVWIQRPRAPDKWCCAAGSTIRARWISRMRR